MADQTVRPHVIDAHVHLFPPDVQAHREAYGARDPFFAYLYNSPRAAMVTPEQLLADMDRDGVAEAVVVGWPWQRHDLCVEHNTWLMEVVRGARGRLRGLAAIQPDAGAAAESELRRCVEGGLVGAGELNADGQRFRLDDAGVRGLAQEAVELGVPLLLHTNEPVGHVYPGKGGLPLQAIYAVMMEFSGLSLVLAHWGGGFPFYELMPEVRRAAANVAYDSAASPLLYDGAVFRTVVDVVGAGKVLFGTDYPLLLEPKRRKTPGFSTVMAQVAGLSLPADDLEKIMGRNAARVYSAVR